MPADDTAPLIADRYQLDRPLGSGGMGEVWAGRDTLLGRPVAVKAVDLTRTTGGERESLRARVLREARAAARIDHPSTVRVYDVVDEEDRVHLVMELVEAPTLKDEVAHDGPLDTREAARVGLDVLGALAAAHAAGIVHRDVKPGNVLVLPDRRVKLADFGIASVKDDPNLTATGMVLGTPTYMSPEAARGEQVGPQADLWGLGALLYFAVEGAAPFDRGEVLPTLNAVLHDEPRPLSRAGALEPVIRALLAKSPELRPSPAEVRRLLDDVLAGGSPTVALQPDGTQVLAATPAPAVVARYDRPATATPPTRRPPVRPPVRRSDRTWLAALGVVAVIAAIAGLLLAVSGDDDEPTAAPGEPSPTAAAPAAETTEPSTTTTTATTTPADEGGGSERYQGDNFAITLPEGWEAVGPDGANGVRFEGPGGTLVVDSVTPAGDDPVAAWEAQEEAFQDDHPSYERVRLEATEYRDHDAAIWEYTFEGMHADNLGFVVGDTGYALNFTTRRGEWDATDELRQAFRESFEPA